MSKVKYASINKLKTFKTAFGEICDVFSSNYFEIVPKIKEEKQIQNNEVHIKPSPMVQQSEESYVTLDEFIRLIQTSNSIIIIQE